MADNRMMAQMSMKDGFIAALDQSGGSTPGALRLYGIPDSAYDGEAQMFKLMHEFRVRIITSPAFNGEKVLGAILFERTHIPEAPWWVVEADDKKRARLNCIAHLLTRIPYQEVPYEKPILPKRAHSPDYHRTPVPKEMYVPDHYANLSNVVSRPSAFPRRRRRSAGGPRVTGGFDAKLKMASRRDRLIAGSILAAPTLFWHIALSDRRS